MSAPRNVTIDQIDKAIVITPEKAILGRTAYLTLGYLLNDGYVSWDNAQELWSTRIANPISEIRKAVEYDDIVNIHIPTKYKYYVRYKLADDPKARARLEKLFAFVGSKPHVQKMLEQVNPKWVEYQLEQSKQKMKNAEGLH